MSHLSKDEIDKIKEEQQIRTGTTIKTVLKLYLGCVGAILLVICLAIVVPLVLIGVSPIVLLLFGQFTRVVH